MTESQAEFSPQDEDFMRQAMALAAKAEEQGEVPVGAVNDGEIIAQGWNRSIGNHDATAHAEIQVLRQAGEKLENYRLLDTTLYVLKAGAAGTVLNIFDSPAAYHYATIEKGLLEDECRQQLQAFFKRRRKEIKALKDEQKRDRKLRDRTK